MAKVPGARRRSAPAPESPTRRLGGSGMVASAAPVRLENLGWDTPRLQLPWQRELWRFVEIIGELNYAAGMVASSFSRSRLVMHDVKDDGEVGGPTKNKKAIKVASTILGSPSERREIMRIAGFNLWLVGEVYIGVISGDSEPGSDQWFAVSSGDIKKNPTGMAYVNLGNGNQALRPGKDILMRSWTPNPNRVSEPDSTARSTRIILRELEKLTLYIFSQIDSRLASGGVFVVPSGMSTGDGTITAQDLMRTFVETASEGLKGEGTAAGIVPIVLEVPTDAVGKLQYLTFSPELSKQALALREEAVKRFASVIDLPAEEITGVGDTNHWSSYQIGPDSVKKHIEPLLARFCLALQRGVVRHALSAAGLDPTKYHIWYDTTPLIVRPQRFQEALELWREGQLSSASLLDAAGFYVSDAPEAQEDVRRYLRELVLRDPQLFNQSSIRALVGVTEEMIPPGVGQELPDGGQQQLLTDKGTPPPPPPAPEKVPQDPVTGRPPKSRDRTPAVAASAAVEDPTAMAMLVLANAVSLRALELAGGRLLDNRTRGTLRGVPRHEIHTRIEVLPEHDMDRLLAGWSELLPTLATFVGVPSDMVTPMSEALRRHCEYTLRSGLPHNVERMITTLQIARVIDGF